MLLAVLLIQHSGSQDDKEFQQIPSIQTDLLVTVNIHNLQLAKKKIYKKIVWGMGKVIVLMPTNTVTPGGQW